MRNINQEFIDDLNTGELSFFLQQVKNKSDELALAIRNGYINIYYRGGSLLKIEKKRNGYNFRFDEKYCVRKDGQPNYDLFHELPKRDAKAYAQHFDLMMREMDSWLVEHPKPEREYQHKLMLHNPSVVDIEYQTGNEIRFDMLCVENGRLYIVENKYGGGAIGGNAGVAAHYEDMCGFIQNTALYNEMLDSVQSIIENKIAMGLLNKGIQFNREAEPVIVFLFADYNPNSKQIAKVQASMTQVYPAGYLMMDANDTTLKLSNAMDFFV